MSGDERRLKVLVVEMGTGLGGASRSLFLTLKNLDPGTVDITVMGWDGNSLIARYEEAGISFRPAGRLPLFRGLPTFRKNAVDFARFLPGYLKARPTLRREAARIATEGYDLIHFNHEHLFLVAALWRPLLDMPFTMHVRTNMWNTFVARWQAGRIAKTIARLIFITENEEKTFHGLGWRGEGDVVYNPVEINESPSKPHPDIPNDGRFKIACLSQFTYLRGIDRLADLAQGLADAGRRDVLFVVAGRMELHGGLPGTLGRVAAEGGSFKDYIDRIGLADMFLFLGQVSDPDRVLASCDMLAKPTREGNPWGRDIMESLAMGKPVLSVGTWARFVENDVTGVIAPDFDLDFYVKALLRLADDRALARGMGDAGRNRVATLSSPQTSAEGLLSTWRATLSRAG